jgi:hypothetical protein
VGRVRHVAIARPFTRLVDHWASSSWNKPNLVVSISLKYL